MKPTRDPLPGHMHVRAVKAFSSMMHGNIGQDEYFETTARHGRNLIAAGLVEEFVLPGSESRLPSPSVPAAEPSSASPAGQASSQPTLPTAPPAGGTASPSTQAGDLAPKSSTPATGNGGISTGPKFNRPLKRGR